MHLRTTCLQTDREGDSKPTFSAKPISRREAAKVIGCGLRGLDKLEKDGEIRSIRVGNKTLIVRASVRAIRGLSVE